MNVSNEKQGLCHTAVNVVFPTSVGNIIPNFTSQAPLAPPRILTRLCCGVRGVRGGGAAPNPIRNTNVCLVRDPSFSQDSATCNPLYTSVSSNTNPFAHNASCTQAFCNAFCQHSTTASPLKQKFFIATHVGQNFIHRHERFQVFRRTLLNSTPKCLSCCRKSAKGKFAPQRGSLLANECEQ
jgi:hypothetical protein